MINSVWSVVELELRGPAPGGSFDDVRIEATITGGERSHRVRGFYDGEGRYRVRFMPDSVGRWSWRTSSNVAELNDQTGVVEVSAAGPRSHGPVRVSNGTTFAHADGTPFLPFGTTVYALLHQPDDLVEQTLETLAKAPFNKVRLCVFPKHFKYNDNEPPFHPFEWRETAEGTEPLCDPMRPNPAFFQHLERVIGRFGEAGIEVDLILFHPYDRWGYARMTPAQDRAYLDYLVTRLAAHANVWWSMANEFDLLPAKSDADWNQLLEIVRAADPYDHLLSVHNCFRSFDHAHPLVTHVSMQREGTAQVAVWSETYGKPAINDECGYEGDLSDIWGNLSGPEMAHRVWEGVLNGGAVSHGETFRDPDDVVFWSKGGRLRGESVARIGFLRRLIEPELAQGLVPIASVKRMIVLAGGPEHLVMEELHAAGQDDQADEAFRMVIPWFFTLGRPHQFYLSYFGSHQPAEFTMPVPHGEHYTATLIDTWAMTETVMATDAVRGQVLQFPAKPYQAIALRRS